MKVAGLLPINFRGVQYNIPVCVWVPQQYPTMPPIPYVQPTPDMDVVRGHQHVGADGMCYFPYCNQWTMHANVSGLLDVMVAAFSAHPPVTAKPPPVAHTAPAPAPAPTYQPPPVQGQGGGAAGSYQQPYSASVPAPAPVPVSAPAPAPAYQPPATQVSEPQRMVEAALVQGLNDRRQELNSQMSELLDDQQRLDAGRVQLNEGMQKLREEKEGLERYLDELTGQNVELQSWLDAHPETDIDPDTIVSIYIA